MLIGFSGLQKTASFRTNRFGKNVQMRYLNFHLETTTSGRTSTVGPQWLADVTAAKKKKPRAIYRYGVCTCTRNYKCNSIVYPIYNRPVIYYVRVIFLSTWMRSVSVEIFICCVFGRVMEDLIMD